MTMALPGASVELHPHFSEQLMADVEHHIPVDHAIGYLKVHAALGGWSPFTVRNVLRELERHGRAQSRLITGGRGGVRRVYRRAAIEGFS